jgi:acyl-coenzyme A thioesterase PaaI-like protein
VNGMELVEAIRAERADPPSGISTLGLDKTHRWITSVEPGRVTLSWEVDDAYLNLEGAVICVWTAALADQAMFFATNTLCAEGEGTRMADLHLRVITNVTGGTLDIDARVLERVGDRMHAVCDFRDESGALTAQVTAVVDVIR